MASGYIKLHRAIQDNPKWLAEAFSRQQAWIDLLLLANHKPTVVYIAGHRIDVQRGEVAWSAVNLANRWRWSKSKFWRFMDELERDGQTSHRNAVLTTVISITNYEMYQSCDTPNESPNESPNDTPSESPSDTQTRMERMKRNKNTPFIPQTGECAFVLSSEPDAKKSRTKFVDAISWTSSSGWTGITESDKASWKMAYPACDLDRQLAAMSEWLKANPEKSRKSRWRMFVTNWLGRSQDRGGDRGYQFANKTPPRPIVADSRGIVERGMGDEWWRKHIQPLYGDFPDKVSEFLSVRGFGKLPPYVQDDCTKREKSHFGKPHQDDLNY